MEYGLILLDINEGIIAKWKDGNIKVICCIQNKDRKNLYKYLKTLSKLATDNFVKSSGLVIGGPDTVKDTIRSVLSSQMRHKIKRILFVRDVDENGLYSLISRT